MKGILAATGDYTPNSGHDYGQFSKASRQKLAALCFCRHFYAHQQYGSHQIFLLALPESYRDWPSRAFLSANTAQIENMLTDDKILLKGKLREQLADAVLQAAAIVEKAYAFLETSEVQELIKKWFADENTDQAQLQYAHQQLRIGARRAIAVLRSKKLVLTDHPQVRDAVPKTGDGDLKESEAFVFQKGDPISVIYIQDHFFTENPVIKGPLNLARIIIHEVFHREMQIKDFRYASNGIRPGTHDLNFAKTINNSDSWAFFFIDAAKQLLPFDSSRALIA